MLAVITNIDRDHMSTYDNDFESLQRTFVDFVHRVPFYGSVVLCTDDAHVRSILPAVSRPMLTYGFSQDMGKLIIWLISFPTRSCKSFHRDIC